MALDFAKGAVNICNNLQKGGTLEEIADFLCKDLTEVQEICRIAGMFALEYDMEQIYRELKSTQMAAKL